MSTNPRAYTGCRKLTRVFRIQMELGDRKNEAKNELKRQDIVIEVRIVP